MTWTKKHDKFALTCKLSESQALVLRDAMRKAKPNEPVKIEMDLRLTNRWIGKVRPEGEYHRKTITGTIAALDEKSQGMITIMKKYSPWVYKILVKPLAFVERTQSAFSAPTRNQSTVNPMFSNDHKNQARELLLQNISKLDSLFQKLGMKYTHDALMRIWHNANKSMTNVKHAVEYMLDYHARKINRAREMGVNSLEELQSKGVITPEAFLHDCLVHGWHFDSPYSEPLPVLDSRGEIINYVDGIMKLVNDCQRIQT
jgi:hypothetical protein